MSPLGPVTSTKNLSHVWSGLRVGDKGLGDIKLAAYILQHWWKPQLVSVASVGMPATAEFSALNAMVPASASFVVLGVDASPAYRSRMHDANARLSQEGFAVRTQIADLTLRGRWARLLGALAVADIGILGIDAAWAVTESDFWEDLRELLRNNPIIVYLRSALDFRHPEVAIRLFRSMPADTGLEILATTPGSLWFAPTAIAAELRSEIASCSLFEDRSPAIDGSAGAAVSELDGQGFAPTARPIVVGDEWVPHLVDETGALPRKIYRADDGAPIGVEFGPGWSTPEPDGRWTEGDHSNLTITLPRGTDNAGRLHVTGNGWVPPNGPSQIVELGLGAMPEHWAALDFDGGADIKTGVLDVSGHEIASSRLMVTIKARNPGRPSDHGQPDTRLLGFKLRSVSLFA